MTIPKWLAVTWAVAIILGSTLYMLTSQGSILQPNPLGGDSLGIAFIFMAAAIATAIWLLTKGTLYKFDVILWFVALWLARAFTHLGPAKPLPPGQKFYPSILGPPIILGVALAVMMTAWAIQKYRKVHPAQ